MHKIHPHPFSCIVLALLLLLGAMPIQAQPPGFSDQLYMNGWAQPVGMLFDNAGAMYVWEKGGKIYIVKDSIKRATPLLDISEEVGNYADFGMLGFVLDPGYATNGYLYVMYIVDRHHLMNFGTPAYNAFANEYNAATIGRITRYKVNNPTDHANAAVDYSTRLVLVGETKETGIPVVHLSHGVGSLLFGTDGTLLALTGDNASYNAQDTGGDVGGAYATQALADGIIRPEENVGAYRSQMVNSLNGKLLRIDPATGNGVPSNPFYNVSAPRAARSRVFALGLRNPCRMAIVPNTGSHYAIDGNPGVLMIGDVGWYSAEELNVLTGPGQNFGWPGYEGNGSPTGYLAANPYNQDVPTSGGCAQPYYRFNDLLKQWNGGALPTFPDLCNPGNNLNPLQYNLFVHRKPAVNWRGGATYASKNGVNYEVGAPGGVPGPDFAGNCAIGGVWYTGDDFPASYKNTLFSADYGGNWIRRFKFDGSFQIDSIFDFATGLGPVVSMATHPTQGGLYYIRVWDNQIRKFYYNPGNRAPKAVATPAVSYSASNSLTVNFIGSGSTDPDGTPIATYSWNFGDATPLSNLANPTHTFTAAPGVPTTFTVTLTVTDAGGLSNSTTVKVSLNNTPPVIVSTSLDPITQYGMAGPNNIPLNAVVTDAEHTPAQLSWAWQTVLHHDTHNHEEPADNNSSTSTVINPIGCETGVTYYYEIRLTVTDAAGLSASFSKNLYPDCVPVTENDAAGYYNGQSVTVNVLANDHSFEPLNLSSLTVTSGPANGNTLVNPDGTITYTHNGGGSNSDSFTYTIADTDGDVSAPGTVTLTRLTPPTIVINTPAAGANIPGNQATITYTLSGNTTGVTGIRFTVDGGAPIVDNSLDGSFQLTGLPLGAHTVVAVLLDATSTPYTFPESDDQVSFTNVSLAAAFGHVMSIVIEEEQVFGGSNHTDFPVMFNLSQPELRTISNGGLLQNANGYDIAFADASGNALDFQVEKYNPVSGNLIVW
ncbi:MAG: PKD domain-containing protein, partial [Bacteroidetes bacterium]